MNTRLYSFKNNAVTNFSLIQAIYQKEIGRTFSLNPTSLLVLIGLTTHYNPLKSIVFPSQAYLANHLNISERSVIRAIKELILKNLIFKSKNGHSNVYCFTNIFFEAVGMSPDKCKMSDKKVTNCQLNMIKIT